MKSNLKGIITSEEKSFIKEISEKYEVKGFLKNLDIFLLKYKAAMQETVTKLNILNEDFRTRYNRSPIENIVSRIKTPESLIKKMLRNDVNFNFDELEKNIFDIAGVRIICSFVSDIYIIAEMIEQNDEFEIVKVKNYVDNPKKSVYRSYHIIVKVPIYLTTGKEYVNVENQIRTMAMNFWASLEHKIKYKYDGNIPIDVQLELVECAKSISDADNKMMNLNDKVHNN